MKQDLTFENYIDEDGNPSGGWVYGKGIDITWQDGPLLITDVGDKPNGALVEGVIEAAIQRLEFYQASKFNCPENYHALINLRGALRRLEERTAEREALGVKGTHTP